MRRLHLIAALSLLTLIAAPATGSAVTGQTVSGTVTITGTAGKDELVIRIFGTSPQMTVTPAAVVTSTNGSCTPDTDPQTGRPVRNQCSAGTINSLILNLAGGDDDVLFEGAVGNVLQLTANAGAGNDHVVITSKAGRTLNGEAGDDVFRIPGEQTAATTTFDGGAGRDLAAYGGITGSNGLPAAVSGSLQSNQVTVKRLEPPNTVSNQRTDTLIGIEALEGTTQGDVLTGGPATIATEVIGGEGPDNLTAGQADTVLSGGPGLDALVGGGGTDTLDGGTGIDTFRGNGRDIFLMRDGYAESVDCVSGNTVINDLTDAVTSPFNCTSVQTAAAKHRIDTQIDDRRLKIGPRGLAAVRVVCPLRKPEPCVGTLSLSKGDSGLASRRYRLARGTATLIVLRLSQAEVARALRGKVVLRAEETDSDGRPRVVERRLAASRRRG